MRRVAVALVTLLVLGATPAAASDRVDIADLLNDPEGYTGEISVAGELVGDFGHRSDAMWTQLNGDSYVDSAVLFGGELTGGNLGVAVRIPLAIAEQLEGEPGGYRVRGPVVEITGTWKYHDPDRGGETYIDVVTLTLLFPSQNLAEHPNYFVLASGLLLVGAAGVLRRKTTRRRMR